MTELIVVGIDGAGFHLLDDWLERGELPNLAALRDHGGATRLRSSHPPVTCPAWRCYSTGVNPGKHGVFWWEAVDRGAQSFSIPTSADFQAPDVWDYLGADGLTSAVVNMPTTYPPEKLEGWLVSGGGGVDGTDYTYPRNLRTELEQEIDYNVFAPGTSSNIGDNPARVESVLDLVDTRFDAAEYLRDEYDPTFLSVTVFYTNVFHHFFWDDDVTLRVWKRVDERLGEFVDAETNVLVMSDHGSHPIEFEFHVNNWLEKEGYLVTTDTVSDSLYGLGLTRDRVTRLVDTLGAKNLLKRIVPQTVVDRFPSDDGRLSGRGKAEKIDWNASTAMASGQGPLYALAPSMAARESVVESIRKELTRLTTPAGTTVARAVHRGHEVYEGPFVEDGPDLVLEPADGIHISGAVGTDSVFTKPGDWVAENHRDGVFFASGPDVRADPDLPDPASIYDLTPTILHWLDTAVPTWLDGRVLEELFSLDADPAKRPVEHSESSRPETGDVASGETGSSEQSAMRERLEDLGYLG